MPNENDKWSCLQLFGGYIQLTTSDLYRYHLRIGPLAMYLESRKLYQLTQEMRHRKKEDPR